MKFIHHLVVHLAVKQKKWLDEYGIKYIEKNLFVTKITREDIKHILEKTENGFEDYYFQRVQKHLKKTI